MSSRTAPFDGIAAWYDAVMQDPDQHGPMTTHANQLVAAELGPGTGTVLDVACGTGLSPRWIAPLGYTVIGVDISADQLSIARDRLVAVRGDAAALPLRDASVDAVITTYSAAPDHAGSAREAFRVLKPGGRYVQVQVHPTFNGSWTERRPDGSVSISPHYLEEQTFAPDHHATSIRGRVGSAHVPLGDYVNATLAAGFRLDRLVEFSEYAGTLPTSVQLASTRP